jgi:ankyrin repeat protein
MGEDVEMVVEDNGDVIFEGWDEEAEAAWVAIGGDPSPCWVVARAIEDGKLDEALFEQIEEGNKKNAAMIIAAGVDVCSRTNIGWTPLHWAVVQASVDIAAFLIESGADIDARTNLGFTPLHISARDGDREMAMLLLKNGADVHAKTEGGFTPLGLAINGRHLSVAALLENWIEEHP